MGASKNANFVTGAIGGELFKATKLYKDVEGNEKPDRSIAQPSPEVKKIEPKEDSATASEKAEAIKDSEVSVKDADKEPLISKSIQKRKKVQKKGKKKEEGEPEGEEESEPAGEK